MFVAATSMFTAVWSETELLDEIVPKLDLSEVQPLIGLFALVAHDRAVEVAELWIAHEVEIGEAAADDYQINTTQSSVRIVPAS